MGPAESDPLPIPNADFRPPAMALAAFLTVSKPAPIFSPICARVVSFVIEPLLTPVAIRAAAPSVVTWQR